MSSNSDVEQEIAGYKERITEYRAEIVAIKNGSGFYADKKVGVNPVRE